MVEAIKIWIVNNIAFLIFGSVCFHIFAQMVLAARRDGLLSAGRRAPDIYFIGQNYLLRSKESRQRIDAGGDFFWRLNELGSDDTIFNVWVILWRISGLLPWLLIGASFFVK